MWKQALKSISALDAVSGREGALAARLVALLLPVCDSVEVDALGNVIVHKGTAREGAKRLLLCAPMDQVGFLVNEVDEAGRLRVCPIGSFSPKSFAYATVRTEGGKGGVLVPMGESLGDTAADYAVDLGATRRADALRAVATGDSVAFAPEYRKLAGHHLCGVGLESRVLVALLLAAAMQSIESDYDLYFVFSCQAQLGARGAGAAAFAIRPDLSLILGGATAREGISVGGGVAIRHRDKLALCDVALVQTLETVAKEHKIAHQHEICCDEVTDLATIQKAAGGRRVCSLALPYRNRKTPAEIVCEKDVDAAWQLLCAILSSNSLQ